MNTYYVSPHRSKMRALVKIFKYVSVFVMANDLFTPFAKAMESALLTKIDSFQLASEDLEVGRISLQDEDFRRARDCFEKAATQESNETAKAWAMIELSKMFLLGQGVEKNREAMARYALRACTIALQKDGLEEIQKIAEILLAPPASPQTKDFAQETPLHMAAIAGYSELTKLLLTIYNNASLEERDRKGYTPLQYAVLSDQYDVFNLLVNAGADVKVITERQQTLLHLASAKAGKKLLGMLLRLDVPFDSPDEVEGWTPLQCAAANGNVAAIELLLESGADIRVYNKSSKVIGRGETPLTLAVKNKHNDAIKLLRTKGAWPDADSLVWAIERNLIDIVKDFADAGIINDKSSDGITPLHAAASTNKHIVKLLLEKGADVSVQDKHKRTPIFSVLQSDLNEEDCLEIIKLLINNGASLSATDDTRETLLHYGVESHSKVLEFLLSTREIEVDAQQDDGVTALMAAAHSSAHSSCLGNVKLLLTAGAKLNLSDKNLNTPLHFAVMGANKEAQATVKLLVEKGADVTACNAKGKTALDETQDIEIAEFLRLHTPLKFRVKRLIECCYNFRKRWI